MTEDSNVIDARDRFPRCLGRFSGDFGDLSEDRDEEFVVAAQRAARKLLEGARSGYVQGFVLVAQERDEEEYGDKLGLGYRWAVSREDGDHIHMSGSAGLTATLLQGAIAKGKK